MTPGASMSPPFSNRDKYNYSNVTDIRKLQLYQSLDAADDFKKYYAAE